MELYEEAVKLALEFDLELAKRVVQVSAEKIEEQEKKRLLLLIATQVLHGVKEIPVALQALKECQLRLEDMLPKFQDFSRIAEVKQEICLSLQSYNRNVDELKAEMDEYTKGAELIRNDLSDLRNRSAFVTANQRCDLCTQPVLTRQFFLFPCTHVFHVDCITKQVREYMAVNPQLRKTVLESDVDPLEDPFLKNTREQHLIEEFAGSECVFCGQMMIESVQEPFFLPSEEAEMKSWEI
jgi:hypothetical protein